MLHRLCVGLAYFGHSLRTGRFLGEVFLLLGGRCTVVVAAGVAGFSHVLLVVLQPVFAEGDDGGDLVLSDPYSERLLGVEPRSGGAAGKRPDRSLQR